MTQSEVNSQNILPTKILRQESYKVDKYNSYDISPNKNLELFQK